MPGFTSFRGYSSVQPVLVLELLGKIVRGQIAEVLVRQRSDRAQKQEAQHPPEEAGQEEQRQGRARTGPQSRSGKQLDIAPADQAAVALSMKAQPVFTYLVNAMKAGDHTVPYSLVTATSLPINSSHAAGEEYIIFLVWT